MWKRILAGAFIAAMVGAIVFGIVQLASGEALAKGGRRNGEQEVAVAQGQRGGWGRAATDGAGVTAGEGDCDVPGVPEQGLGQGARGSSARTAETTSGRGRGSSVAIASGRGSGQGAQGSAAATSERGAGNGAQGQGSETAAPVETLVTVQGIVLETVELVVDTGDGNAVQIGLGPSQYREERGFVLNVGDEVIVTGFWEDDEFKALTVENLDLETEIVLRDPAGRPMWSGQGRRSGL